MAAQLRRQRYTVRAVGFRKLGRNVPPPPPRVPFQIPPAHGEHLSRPLCRQQDQAPRGGDRGLQAIEEGPKGREALSPRALSRVASLHRVV